MKPTAGFTLPWAGVTLHLRSLCQSERSEESSILLKPRAGRGSEVGA